MSSKSKTSSTTNQVTDQATHNTVTPTNPQWAIDPIQSLAGNVNKLAGTDPYSLIAGPDPLQTQAASGASGLGHWGDYAGLGGAGGAGPAGAGLGTATPEGPNASGILATDANGGVIPRGPDGAMSQEQLDAMNANRRAAGQMTGTAGSILGRPPGAPPPGMGVEQMGGPAGGAPGGAGPAPTGPASSGNPFTDALATFNATRGSTANTAGAGASLLDGLSGYISPYTNDVVNTTLAGFDKNAGYSRAQDMLAKGNDATFGGSGGAIQTALNEQNIAQERAATEAGLRDKAFTTGAGLSNEDAARRQQAAQFDAQQHDAAMQRQLAGAAGLADVGSASDANARANVGAQGSMGSILQALAQARAGAPLSLTGALSGITGSLPLGLVHGQTDDGTVHGTQTGTSNSTTTSSDPMKTLGSLALTAGALFGAPFTGGASLGALLGGVGELSTTAAPLVLSDRRAKTDIKRVGELDDGLGVFSYRYKGGGPKHIGVMAQEVAKVKPRAVHNIGGLLAVDYGAL